MKNTMYSRLAVDSVDRDDVDIKIIYEHIHKYCQEKHKFDFSSSNPTVRLHEPTFSAPEIIAALEVLLSTKVTMGPAVKGFEEKFTDLHMFGHGVSSNSGSSANLLAIAALANVETANRLRPGDEVIVPALSWSTTVWPLVQHNLVPVIVDVDPITFNIDPNEIERAIGPKTRAIMPVHVYGNPCDMNAIQQLCNKHNLILIEDCCEALGAEYGNKPVGSFGDAGTFSFYFSHHMTTLEGGITVTNRFDLAETMRILRAHGWIRELENKQPYLDKYPEIDPRFLFVNQGYNLRITEVQAAIGLVQLPKLHDYVLARRKNTTAWKKDLSVYCDVFSFQDEMVGGKSSCFGFPIVVNAEASFDIGDLTSYLNGKKIETRPIICGNIAAQPAMKLYEHRVVGDMKNSTNIMKNGFSIGNHQAINNEAREYVNSTIKDFLAKNKYD